MAGELPRDCKVTINDRRCGAATRWLLIDPEAEQERPICNVHRPAAADLLVSGPGWVWVDRRTAQVHPAHAGCLGDLASVGQSQTCQGAGSVSRVVCPLTLALGSGSPR